MGTEHSSAETRKRAKDLAERIGAYHTDLNMDTAVAAVQGIFTLVTGKKPRFGSQGGSNAENLALQNIQVRFDPPLEGEQKLTCAGEIEDGVGVHVCAALALGQR